MGASSGTAKAWGRVSAAAEVACPGGPPIVLPEWKLRSQPAHPREASAKTVAEADGGSGASPSGGRRAAQKLDPLPEEAEASRLASLRSNFAETFAIMDSFEGADDVKDFAKSKALAAKQRVMAMAGFAVDYDEEDYSEGEGQDHVLTFSDEMTTDELEDLQEKLIQLENTLAPENLTAAMERIRRVEFDSADYGPPATLQWERKRAPKMKQGINVTPIREVTAAVREYWWHLGLNEIREGRVGVIVLAGGDGSRLPDDPFIDKRFRSAPCTAVLNVGLLSQKSIFQLLCERATRLESLLQRQLHMYVDMTILNEPHVARRRGWVSSTGVTQYPMVPTLPFYIMTNSDNRQGIEDFFAKHDYFNRGLENFVFFVQESVPLVSKRGKILMRDKKSMLMQPGGSGGVFEALRQGGIVMDLKARNIASLYITNCDNVLSKPADPKFLGHCLQMGASFGLKSVERTRAEDPLGLLAHHRRIVVVQDEEGGRDTVIKNDGCVLEHYEIDKIRERRTNDQRFVFFAGNLCQYFCTVQLAVSATLEAEHALPVRASHFSPSKKRTIQPPEGVFNAFRLESLVSDICTRLSKVVSLHVDRDAEYAPVKSPLEAAIAVATLGLLHQSWIKAGGGHFAADAKVSVSHDSRCEVSPLVSYEGEGLTENWCQALSKTKAALKLPLLVASGQENDNSTMPRPLPTGSNKRDMRFVHWSTGTLDEVDKGPTPVRDWFDNQARGYMEAAHHAELLPDTPRWLRDQELHWQEIMAQKLKSAQRERHQDMLVDASTPKSDKGFEQLHRLRTRTRPKRPDLDEGRKEDVVYGCARYRENNALTYDKSKADLEDEDDEDV